MFVFVLFLHKCACALRGPGDHREETKRRTAAMMLSRTGRDKAEAPLSIVARLVRAAWRAAWGCVAGAPYQGTASPPPLLHKCVYVCAVPNVCVCVCVWWVGRSDSLLRRVDGWLWVCVGIAGWVGVCAGLWDGLLVLQRFLL